MPRPTNTKKSKRQIGHFLKEVRQSRGLSLRAVEKITEGKISNGYLSQLENGDISAPSAIMLHRLSAAYGIEYGTLMERAGFVTEDSAPATRLPTSVLGELSHEEEEELLKYLGYLRSQKGKHRNK